MSAIQAEASSVTRERPTVPAPTEGLRLAHLLWLTLLAAGIRCGWVGLWAGGVHIGPDINDCRQSSDGYVILARNLNETGRFAFTPHASPTAHRGPAYPVAIAGAWHLTGSYRWAFLLVNLLAGTATVVLIYLIALRFYSPSAAFAGAALAGVYPLHVYYTASSFSDTFLTAAFALLAWTTLVALRERNWPWIGASGVAYGLLMLTKPILALFPIALLPLVCIRRKWAVPVLAQTLIMVLVVLPWLTRNRQVTGAGVLSTGGGFNLLVGNYMIDHGGGCDAAFKAAVAEALGAARDSQGRPVPRTAIKTAGYLDVDPALDATFFHTAVGQYLERPTRLLRKMAVNLGRFWYFASSPVRCLLTALVNLPLLVLAGREWYRLRGRPEIAWVIAAVAYTWLTYAAIIVHSRFYLAVMPLVLPFAAAGLLSLLSRRPGREPRGC